MRDDDLKWFQGDILDVKVFLVRKTENGERGNRLHGKCSPDDQNMEPEDEDEEEKWRIRKGERRMRGEGAMAEKERKNM